MAKETTASVASGALPELPDSVIDADTRGDAVHTDVQSQGDLTPSVLPSVPWSSA